MDHTGPDDWRQVNLWFHDAAAAENAAVACLRPHLAAESTMAAWWFTRKSACWRVRYSPLPGRAAEADAAVRETARNLANAGTVIRWAPTVYEPETAAFGGDEAMRIAHQLFTADSQHVLTYLHLRGLSGSRSDHRREIGLLLASALMRAAGCDWYEQGDVWTRLTAHRAPGSSSTATDEQAAESVKHLITSRRHAPGSPLASQREWADAFTETGQRLAELADGGQLTRGLRAVLAHHVLFAWNRAGIPARQQARLAAVAVQVIFHTDPGPITAALRATTRSIPPT